MLVGLLDEPEESVVRTAADLLGEHPFKEEHFATLARLASGASLAARRFALGKMAELDSSKVVKTLLGHLDDSDIVAARADTWKRDQTNGLVGAIDAALERNDRLYGALLHVANQVAPTSVAAMLDERGAKLFREKKFDRAIRRLAVRVELPEASDEARFLLALARLRATRRDLGAIARKRDEALDLLATLDRGTFPLAERLRKARLSTEELFYVGFNFAEDAATRDTATTLLDLVTRQSPRSKVGRAARNKLALLERAAG
jgi:hypothetical protein